MYKCVWKSDKMKVYVKNDMLYVLNKSTIRYGLHTVIDGKYYFVGPVFNKLKK